MRIIKKSSVLPLIILFLILSSINLFSQTKSQNLVTDRPDKTESAIVVPINSYQIETGFVFHKQKFVENNNEVENENLIFASTLFRYGVTENIELRFGGEYLSGKSTVLHSTKFIDGIQGLFLGSKMQLQKDEKIISDAAIIARIDLPFGNLNLRPDRFEPSLILSLAQNINENFSLGVNFGLFDNSKIDQYTYFYSTSLGISLTEKIGLFIELYGDIFKNLSPVHNFDFGITYLHLPNLQLDFSTGTILVGDNTEYFGGLGIALRLPH